MDIREGSTHPIHQIGNALFGDGNNQVAWLHGEESVCFICHPIHWGVILGGMFIMSYILKNTSKGNTVYFMGFGVFNQMMSYNE